MSLSLLDGILFAIVLLLLIGLFWQISTQNKYISQKTEALLREWKANEYERLRQELTRQAEDRAKFSLKEQAEVLRADAIKRSGAVTLGKVSEQLAPYLPGFPYHPSDIRFFGSPIDLIVFDGLSEGQLKEIIFLEIKSGLKPTLNTREKQVRECLERKSVRYELLSLKTQESAKGFA